MENMNEAFDRAYKEYLTSHAQLPEALLNDYEIVSCLWESSEKETYLVRAKADRKKYILKTAKLACRENPAAEYELLSTLSHPNLPFPKAFHQTEDRVFLVREYIEGRSLLQYVDEKGPLDIAETVRIALSLCDTISYLHALEPPVIHRDIKPQNVILTPSGTPKLIDFGIARRFSSDAARDTAFLGTEATAAPEQFGYRQTDVRTDLYSLGVLTLFLCTETYDVNNCRQLVKDARLAGVIAKCTSFSPEDRYASAQQLCAALARIKPHKAETKKAFLPSGAFIAAGIVLGFLLYPLSAAAWKELTPSLEAFAPAAATATPAQTEEPPASPAPATTQEEKPVVFVSPLIEQAVREALAKEDAEPIWPSELKRVTKILICGNTVYQDWYNHSNLGADQFLSSVFMTDRGSISDLSDLSKLTGLTELALYNQNITDISPLEGLHLTKLGLGSNSIVDISALAQMITLHTLDVSCNPVADVSPLLKLTGITELDVSGIYMEDYAELSVLPLQRLSLMDCPIRDYSFLRDFGFLNGLMLNGLTQENLSQLSSLNRLSDLFLRYSNVENLDFLKTMTGLTSLNFTQCTLRSLDGIEYSPKLNDLCILGNPLEDLTPLSALSRLRSLNLCDIAASDFSVLKELPFLTRVQCDASQEGALRELADERGIELVVNR